MSVIDDKLRDTISKLQKLKTGTIFNLINSDIPDIEYHIKDLIPKAMMTVIFGEGESFKTGFALHIALALASGRSTFHFKNDNDDKIKVMWIDEEMGIIGLKQKVVKLMNGMDIKPDEIKDTFFYRSITGFKIDDKNTKASLTSFIYEYNPQIIFMDSLSRCMIGEENQVTDIRKVHETLRSIQADTNVAFVIIHHVTKANHKLSLQSLRGSGDIGNQVDMALGMQRVSGNKFFLSRYKWRYQESGFMPINFVVNDVEDGIELSYAGTVRDNIALKISVEMQKWFMDNPSEEYHWNEILAIMEKRKFKETSIKQAINILIDGGLIKRVRQGIYKMVVRN